MAMSRSLGGTWLTTRPPMTMSPEVIVSSPAIMARRVDFPQPDGPTSTMNSPVSASRLMPFSTSTLPKRLLRLRMLSDAILLDRSLGEAADEIAAAEEIDEEWRQRADQHRRAGHIELADVLAGGAEGDDRRGDRLVAAGGEDD